MFKYIHEPNLSHKSRKKGGKKGKIIWYNTACDFMQICFFGNLCELGSPEHLKWHLDTVSGLKIIPAFSCWGSAWGSGNRRLLTGLLLGVLITYQMLKQPQLC